MVPLPFAHFLVSLTSIALNSPRQKIGRELSTCSDKVVAKICLPTFIVASQESFVAKYIIFQRLQKRREKRKGKEKKKKQIVECAVHLQIFCMEERCRNMGVFWCG
jgi:hypothetical protein